APDCASPPLLLSLLADATMCSPFPYTTLFRSLRLEVRTILGCTEEGRAPAEQAFYDGSRAVQRKADRPHHERGNDRQAINPVRIDRKSTRLNSSHVKISYAVFCLKKKNHKSRR